MMHRIKKCLGWLKAQAIDIKNKLRWWWLFHNPFDRKPF